MASVGVYDHGVSQAAEVQWEDDSIFATLDPSVLSAMAQQLRGNHHPGFLLHSVSGNTGVIGVCHLRTWPGSSTDARGTCFNTATGLWSWGSLSRTNENINAENHTFLPVQPVEDHRQHSTNLPTSTEGAAHKMLLISSILDCCGTAPGEILERLARHDLLSWRPSRGMYVIHWRNWNDTFGTCAGELGMACYDPPSSDSPCPTLDINKTNAALLEHLPRQLQGCIQEGANLIDDARALSNLLRKCSFPNELIVEMHKSGLIQPVVGDLDNSFVPNTEEWTRLIGSSDFQRCLDEKTYVINGPNTAAYLKALLPGRIYSLLSSHKPDNSGRGHSTPLKLSPAVPSETACSCGGTWTSEGCPDGWTRRETALNGRRRFDSVVYLMNHAMNVEIYHRECSNRQCLILYDGRADGIHRQTLDTAFAHAVLHWSTPAFALCPLPLCPIAHCVRLPTDNPHPPPSPTS